ncbi:MAG: hypothetical protein ACLRIL_08500 [Fusicatenibacter saccharivorans]
MFQGLNLAREKLNHYEKMRMRQRKKMLEDGSGAFGTEDASGEINITGSRGTIVYIGEAEEHSVGAVVCEWCRYMKYEVCSLSIHSANMSKQWRRKVQSSRR